MSEPDEQVNLTEGSTDAPAGIGWSPESNPVESFTSTIEHALQQLSRELAAIRAERDGLRLELEGLRAQYELLRTQLKDRDRFQATVRELSDLVRMLNVPASWTTAPTPPAPPPPEPMVPLAGSAPAAEPPPPPQPAAPTAPVDTPGAPSEAPAAPQATQSEPAPQAAPAEAPAPATELQAEPPAAEAAPADPPSGGYAIPAPSAGADTASTEWAFAAPAAEPAPDPFAWAAPSSDQPETDWSDYLGKPADEVASQPSPDLSTTAPDADVPAADPAPHAVWVPEPTPPAEPEPPAPPADHAAFAPSFSTSFSTPAAEPTPDPAPTPEPTPPPLHFVLPSDDAPPSATTVSSLETGVWQLPDPPPTGTSRRPSADTVTLWAKRVVSAIGIVLILSLLLIAVGPKVLPYQTFFVRSGSMEPTIEVGELIFLTKVDAADLDEGDIITFERPDRPGVMVTHRIVAIEQTDAGKVFQTKGDANGSPDTWRVPAVGKGWRYAVGIPKLGYVFGYLNTPIARLAMLVVPAIILGLLSLVDIWRPSSSRGQPSRRRR